MDVVFIPTSSYRRLLWIRMKSCSFPGLVPGCRGTVLHRFRLIFADCPCVFMTLPSGLYNEGHWLFTASWIASCGVHYLRHDSKMFLFPFVGKQAGPVLHGGCCGGSWPYQHPARTEGGTQFVLLCGNQGLKQEGVRARTSAAVTPDKKHRHGNSNSVVQLQHGHPQMNVPRKQTFRSLRLFWRVKINSCFRNI